MAMTALRRTLSLRLAHVAKTYPCSSSVGATAKNPVFGYNPFFHHCLLPGNGTEFVRFVIRPFSTIQKPTPLPPDHSTPPKEVPPRLLPPPVGAIAVAEGKTSLTATKEEKKEAVEARWVEAARARMRVASCLSRTEFLRMCREEAGSDEQGTRVARSLDESGAVIVWGDTVIVRPEEVAQEIEKTVLKTFDPLEDQMREELRKMEEKMAEIGRQAASRVRREMLLGGFLFLAVNIAASTGLVFEWVKWDLLEPIGHFVNSFYFIMGFIFFVWTSKDLSFAGYFKRRLVTHQMRLAKAQRFDLARLNKLRSACLR